MKTRLKLKKKPILFILLALILVGIGTTIAYYYSEVIIPNQFKTMTYDVLIEEEFNDDWGTKKVNFVNKEDTNVGVVLRINYNESWKRQIKDIDIALDNNVNGTNIVNKVWTDAFNSDFLKGDDGWYYYKKVLNGGEEVQVLESISLNEELIKTSPYYEDYKVADYELIFNFEAIQADKKAIQDIWMKDVTIKDDGITWTL